MIFGIVKDNNETVLRMVFNNADYELIKHFCATSLPIDLYSDWCDAKLLYVHRAINALQGTVRVEITDIVYEFQAKFTVNADEHKSALASECENCHVEEFVNQYKTVVDVFGTLM